MSTPFYDLASLVVVPSGYKASKVYAQKPLTTDGQLTFSRASTATRVNSAGLIETVSSNVPRLDYLGSTCPKLFLEPSRTNLTTYSEQFDNAVWTKVATSVTANSVISPDGSTNADTLTADGTNAEHQLRSTGVISLTSGTTYTTSIFAKAGTNNFIQFVGSGTPYPSTTYANFDLGTGTLGDKGANVTSSIVNYGNGWYRCIMTVQATGTTNVNTFLVNIVTSKTAPRGQANTLSTNVHLWGAMIEAGAYATSYVKTEAAAVTRLADACSKTGISSLIGQTEGTFFVDFIYDAANTANERLTISNGTSAERIFFIITTTGLISYNATDGSTDQWSISSTLTVGQRYKIAGAYKANDVVFYINGVQIGTDTSATIPTCSNLYFANENGSTQEWNNPMNQLLLFKTRLTNAQLAELTTL